MLRVLITVAVVPFKPFDHKRAWEEILLPLYFTNGGLDIKQTLFAGNEPIFPAAKRLLDNPIVQRRMVQEVWQVSHQPSLHLGPHVHSC